jgi:phage terminase large subunit
MASSLDISIPEKLLPIFNAKERFIDIYGGRGSGKSWTVADFLLIKGVAHKVNTIIFRKKRILCTREIQNTIKDSVYKLLVDRINLYKLDKFYDIKNDSIIGRNGTEFIFKGLLRNPQDIKSMEGIDYCWCEEAQSISRKSLDILIPTIRKDNSQIIFTYNPTNEDDPVHVDYTLSDKPNVLRIECNYSDNPFFPEVLRDEMEWDRAHDPDKYEHIWQGKCVKHSQAQVFYGKWVIDDFEKFEIVEGKEEKVFPSRDTFYYQGADWGFSQDPLAFVKCFVVDRKLYISDEIYGVGIDIDFIPGKFQEIHESNKYPITADSSRPDTINYVKRHGFPLIRKSIKGKGSVEDGIAFLRSFEKIIIHPRCKHTIDEFRLYQYQIDSKTGAISNKLEDKNNHVIDGLRYAVEDLMRLRKVEATKGIYR